MSRIFFLLLACWSGVASALEAMAEEELAQVVARDGLRFDFKDFELSGSARVTYTSPTGASAWWGNLYAARSDDPGREFSDPYRLDIVARPGLADSFVLSFPDNPDGLAKWRIAWDWGVSADGVSREGGAFMMRDLVLQGGNAQWTTPTDRDGTAWGLGIKAQIADLYWLSGAQNAALWADPNAAVDGLRASGIRIGAGSLDPNASSPPAGPWQIAEVTRQPGILNVEPAEEIDPVTGTKPPRLHFGIGWPVGGEAAVGSISVDSVRFINAGLPSVDLGSSRIAGIQIQFLDVKFRP